jgi:Zn-dependent protease
MGEIPNEAARSSSNLQAEFEKVSSLVSEQFQIEESLLENGVPTYYLKQPQETKRAFLKLLEKLTPLTLIAILRRSDNGRIVLRVVPKPLVKPSNILINWLLLLATIGTTFISGYLLSADVINPFLGGAAFTIALLAVLGTHEMGHKITANKKGMEATVPYFIPGPPPFGTFGAVIMQKSLPPNKDALFDVGADGPIAGFVIATIVSIVGLTLLIPSPPIENAGTIQMPILWILLARFLNGLNLLPNANPGQVLLLHPVAFAGWVGIVVTMLNLLPAAMLDGGHVVRSLAGEKARLVLTVLSIAFLFVEGFLPMALFVVFISMFKHPGPLDDVSDLSRSRKILAVVLVIIFILCVFPEIQPFWT